MFKSSTANHDVGKKANRLTLICALTIAATMTWGRKTQDTLQAKMIWARSKVWGHIVCARSWVDVEPFLRRSLDLPGGTSLSIHTDARPGEVPPGPFTNFHLTVSRVCVYSVWLWPQSLARNCFVQYANFGKDTALNGEGFITTRGEWCCYLFCIHWIAVT